MKTRLILLLFISVLTTLPVLAQNTQKHEISLFTAGGLFTLSYNPYFGNTHNKLGYKFGVGYSYNINKLWSLGTGLEFAIYSSEYNLDQYSDQYMTDDGIQDFQFTTSVRGYQEQQTLTLLNIPIYGQINIPLSNKMQIYTLAGIKIGIPLSSKYEVLNVELRNSGHFLEPENVIYDSQQFMGFGNFNLKQEKQNLNLQTSIICSIESGMKFRLTSRSALYTGLYFEHSLTNLDNNSSKNNLVEYNKVDPENFKLNGVLSSKLSTEQQGNRFAKNIHLVSFGLKIRYSILL